MQTSTPDQNQILFERAQRVIPGGVNSPVRAFRAVGGTPRFGLLHQFLAKTRKRVCASTRSGRSC